MDIVCGKCGNHSTSIEQARAHAQRCESKDKPTPRRPGITPEAWENIVKALQERPDGTE